MLGFGRGLATAHRKRNVMKQETVALIWTDSLRRFCEHDGEP
jgi:hypothetical protein